ncbi:unnamed protein product [Cuscuta epithymum]|uniref:RNA-binding protein AU-1/Ribonuclease E/G domain-containing protein n=2 Tax=Cuscuta epithymum TaxID=186058 RepID=A0AAV0D7D6_9ASTE|nr:unnamed protein product [Cuscuta epithymum]
MKGDMLTSSDTLCKSGLEFSVLGHFPLKQQGRSLRRNARCGYSKMPCCGIFKSWMMGRCGPVHLFIPLPSKDEYKLVKCFKNSSNVVEHIPKDLIQEKFSQEESYFVSGDFLLEETDISSHCRKVRNGIVEEPWLLQQSLVSHQASESDASDASGATGDSPVTSYKSGFPIEEPWLAEWVINFSISNAHLAPDMPTCEQHARSIESHHTTHNEHCPEFEKPLSSESDLITKEDSVTTVILINSSVCTMQRIAILENGSLVELLLEPVKNKVHCDSVYLGVVTQLAPQMCGTFVNIGSNQTAFMNIKSRKEPFIFPPFSHDRQTIAIESVENSDHLETEATSDEVIEEDDTEDDDSGEYSEHDFEEQGNHDKVHSSVDIEGNVGHDGETHFHRHPFKKIVPHHEYNKKSKWGQVRKGTKIIVQVVKEGLGRKGPTVTAYPKLRSRFWVLKASGNTIGISRKIFGAERTRLKVIAKTLQPPGFGVTVRTVAAGHSLEELKKDLEGLVSTWKVIMEHAKSAALAADEGVDGAVPIMLHRAMGQTLSIVQDYFNDKVKSMVVDSPRTYHEVKNYLQEIAPNLSDRVELYSNKAPLFDEYKIEGEIDSILSKRVSLSNGGYLVIEQTEALFSIDVNGGHSMLRQGTSQEKAILEVNLAAARQIARELRLRDIGGLIVVDFIDMMDDSNKRLVYEEVKKAVGRDRSTVSLSELSRHGLMEITRKRVRPSVTFMISQQCTCCYGTGRVEALETAFSKIEREISRLMSRMDEKADPEDPNSWPRFILMVDQYMCNYLTEGKKTKLAVLSTSLKVWIVIKVARGFTRGTFELKPFTDADKECNKSRPPIPVLSAEAARSLPQKKVNLFPIKKWKAGGGE